MPAGDGDAVKAAHMLPPVVTATLILLLAACASPAPLAGVPGSQEPGPGQAVELGLRPGARAPDFQVTALDGQPLTKEQLLGEGKPLVLYFFATW